MPSNGKKPSRMAVADRRQIEEYNAFGPWVDDVLTADEIPPLFENFPLDLAHSRVLKFPRAESRRELSPGMDLYDHLMAVGPDRLIVLSREGDGFVEATVEYDRIVAITDSVDLLDGRLDFVSTDGSTFSVSYNGSSRETMAELVDLVRAKTREATPAADDWIALPAPEAGTPLLLAMDDLGKRDVALVSLFNTVLRADEDVRLVAGQGRTTVRPRTGILSRLSHLIWPTALAGMVLCGTGTELQVLTRRTPLTRGGRPEVSLARTVIEADRLDSVEARGHPEFARASIVTLRAGRATIEFVVPAASALERALLAL